MELVSKTDRNANKEYNHTGPSYTSAFQSMLLNFEIRICFGCTVHRVMFSDGCHLTPTLPFLNDSMYKPVIAYWHWITCMCCNKHIAFCLYIGHKKFSQTSKLPGITYLLIVDFA